jgi:hypothetical protein
MFSECGYCMCLLENGIVIHAFHLHKSLWPDSSEQVVVAVKQEITFSNLDRVTGYPEISHDFISCLRASAEILKLDTVNCFQIRIVSYATICYWK